MTCSNSKRPRAFAERILSEGGTTPESRIAFAYRTVLSRPPQSEELQIMRQALDDFLVRYRDIQKDGRKRRSASAKAQSAAARNRRSSRHTR